MLPELEDEYKLLERIHDSIDKMLEGLTDEQLLRKPLPNFNNIASVLDHTARVERRFFSAVAGDPVDTKSQEPFQVDEWDLGAIRAAWADALAYARQVLEGVEEGELEQPGLKLGIGDLNKRQLVTYAIAHTAHHRGQIPLIRKLLG
ncbi:MAG: DinB family protein [Alicyclobacillus sp.]|nr:DinB family protein [Alicyclobacillus sp.]